MSPLLAIHAAATWFMVGMIWMVQIVHYPLFALLPKSDFVAYARGHTKSMGRLLALPAGTEVVSALLLVWMVPDGVTMSVVILAGLVLAVLWIGTGLVQAPIHGRLVDRHDSRLIDRLVTSNWWRTAGWSLRGALVTSMVL